MPKLSKQKLLSTVEAAIHESGWNFLRLSEPKAHPAEYRVYRETESYPVRVYIWNLSHGGGRMRPLHEFRIQITGIEDTTSVQQFQPHVNGKTLILGWWPDAGVFAGFDYAYHAQPLGASPSIQVDEAALRAAQSPDLHCIIVTTASWPLRSGPIFSAPTSRTSSRFMPAAEYRPRSMC
nr:hypothetical protein [uncultured Rhodopila sp.]